MFAKSCSNLPNKVQNTFHKASPLNFGSASALRLSVLWALVDGHGLDCSRIQPTSLDVSPRETRCPREKRRRATNSYFRPQIGRDYPLNLSIKLVVTTVTQNQRRSVLECYRRAREGGGANTHTYIGREPNRGVSTFEAPNSHWNQES